MPRSWYTIAFLFSFLVTAGVLQWWQVPVYPMEVWGTLGVLGILLFAAHLVLWFQRSRFVTQSALWQCKVPLLLLVSVCGVALGFHRIAATTHVTEISSIEAFAQADCHGRECPEVSLRGFIIDEPDRRPMKSKYTVKAEELKIFPKGIGSSEKCVILRRPAVSILRDAASLRSAAPQDDTAGRLEGCFSELPIHKPSQQVSGKVLVTDYAAWPQHDYGDEVLVTGVLKRPEQIEEFQYDHFLSRYDIYSVMSGARVEKVSSGQGNHFFVFLYGLKNRFEAKLDRLLPEPHASLAAGLLTGSRRGIPEHLLRDFQATGLTHIIAISGYNITIVISMISGLLFFLPHRLRIFPALSAIIFFTLFVGASASVVRAAIMGGLGLVALLFGREKHAFIAILLAAALMVAWNPKVLWYDVGFQLSFLSVLGLTFLEPFLMSLSRWIPNIIGFREAFHMTIAAQLAAVPLVIFVFGHFSLIAPVTNMLVALLIPVAMLFTFLGTSLSFLSFSLGMFVSYIGWGALTLIMGIAHFFASLPFTFLATPSLSSSWVWGYYALLAGAIVTHWLLSREKMGIAVSGE